eukprot:TRINITY_DN77_c0_g1_i1.p1 TRINITY_DN77_c0_g1~~TRINITY_DN77_c0_g1_i1.p1  ORF type:complete len:1476 (+),score=481.22 TRINITY_DN77_c0_g1_i1:310-4428(+)
MGELGHLNEPAVLYNLKKRYEKDLFHTYSGLFLVVVNPYKRLPIYGNDIIDVYRGKSREKVAPHIFAMSDVAYRAMLQEDRNQSMLITGESGAGKTENTKKVIQYLTRIAGRSDGETLLEEQLLQFNPILEALGNAKTKKNNNSSRFGKFIELQFNSGGQIAGAHTRIYLLEKSRVVFQASMERNFHVFYQIMYLEPELKEKFRLTRAEDFSFISRKGANGEFEPLTVEGIDDRKDFELTRSALGTLKIQPEDQNMIWQTLAAILHMGNLPFTEVSKDVAGLADEKVLAIVAGLLGVETAKLRQCILSPSLAALSDKEKTFKQLSKPKAERSRDALCKALYGNLFLWVVKQINEELSHSEQQAHFIGVLDISGFEIFEVNSFEQICINYTNEKLQQFFNHHMFNLEQEEYKREGLTDWKFEDYGMDLQDTIDLIEKEGYGILSILEEQCLIPEADDKSFTVKLHTTHSAHRNFRAPKFFGLTFKIYHYAGEVDYTTTEWIDKNRDPLEADLKELMLRSSFKFVRDLFDEKLTGSNLAAPAAASGPGTPSGGRAAPGTATRRRAAGAAFTYVSRQYKEQLNHLMSVLNSTSPHFIRCIIPNLQKKQNSINDKLVLDQLKCNGVLEGIRIARKGWPNRIKYPEFIKRYYLLKPGLDPKTPQPKESTKDLCAHLVKTYPDKIFADQMRMGLTKIFFRSGQLAAFENIREQIISTMVVSIQAASRAFLARREYNKMREQEIAAKTIQRNVRGYIDLVDSLWYKLFVTGRPMINRRDFLKEIELLSKQLASLQKQLANLNEEIARLKKERSESDDILARVEKEYDDIKAKHAALESEISSLKKEKETLSEKLNLSEDALKEESSRGNALGREKTDLEKTRTELEHNLNDEKERNKALEEAKRKAEADRDDWEDKLDLAQSRVSDHQKKIAELQKQFDEQEGRAHDMDQLATQLNAKLNSLAKNLAAAEEDFTRENSDKSGLDNTRKDLQAQVEAAKSNLDDIREKVTAANAQAKRLDSQLADTNLQLDEQRAKLNKSEKSGKEYRGKAKDLADALEEETAARNNAEKAKSALDARFNELTSQVRSLESAKSVSADQTKALKNQLDDLTKRVEDGEAANNRLKNENKAAQEEEADLNDRLEQEREGAKKEKKRLTAKIQELTNLLENAPKGDAKSEDLRKMEDQIRDIEDQTKAAEDAKAKADAANAEYANSLKDLKEKLAEVEKRAAENAEANRKAKEALDQMTRELEKQEDARALLEAKNRHAAAEVEDLKRKISAFAGDAGRTSDLTAHYKSENVGLKADFDDLEKDNKILAKDVRDARAKFDEVLKQAGTEKAQKTRLQNSNAVLKKLVMDRILSNNEILNQLKTHSAHFSGEQ